MGKTINLTKLSKMQQATAEVQSKKADLKLKVETPPVEEAKEKRTVKMGSYVKPSEKEQFLSLIGRKSESDGIRDLILKFIEEHQSSNL
jgi:hypothetical protein